MTEERTVILREKKVDTFAFLVGVAGVKPEETFLLDQAVFQIGCGKSNELTISNSFTSIESEHARILFDNDDQTFILIDLGTKEGTFVNRTPIDRHPLQDNDYISLGNEIGLIFKQAW